MKASLRLSTVTLELYGTVKAYPTMDETFLRVVKVVTTDTAPALLVIHHDDGECWMFPVERIHSVHSVPDPDPAQPE